MTALLEGREAEATPLRDRRGVGDRRPPARSRGALVLFALAAFAFTRFVVAEPAPRREASPQQVSNPVTARARDLDSLEAAVAADPQDLRATQALGVAYVRTAANGDPTYYDLARRAFAKADDLARDDPATAVGRGLLALSLHDFAAALELADEVLARFPDLDSARLVRIDALVELGRYERAERDLDHLLATEVGLPQYARVSYLRQINGDLDGAIVAMRQAVTAGADTPFDQAEVRALLGDLLLLREEPDAAAVEYDRALAARPDLAAAKLGRARVLVVRNQLGAAITELESLTTRVPLPAALVLLGELYEQRGESVAARRTFDTVRVTYQLQADRGQVVDLEAAIFEADHGDATRALEFARAAYDARPDNVFVADAMAWALHVNGRNSEAREFATRALRLGTIDAGLRLRSAVLLVRS